MVSCRARHHFIGIFGAIIVSAIPIIDGFCTGLHAEEPQRQSEIERACTNFEVSYRAGVATVTENDWATAQILFSSALKALGKFDHPNKAAAQALLAKAQMKLEQVAEHPAKPIPANNQGEPADESSAQVMYTSYDKALDAGLDFLSTKKWSASIAAFESALKFKPQDAAAAAGLKQAKKNLGTPAATHEKNTTKTEEAETVPQQTAQKTLVADPPRETIPDQGLGGATQEPAAASPMPSLPRAEVLNPRQWLVGAGSQCIWSGHLCQLNEGDMKFRTKLKGDFQASITIEARMDHRSNIRIDLRPDQGQYPKISGYGSKEGSGPYLTVNKQVTGQSGEQPALQQIALGFIRSGKQIVFYCNGLKIAETFDIPNEAELYLWVCGKGDMNGAKVVGGE